jgi:hypothetical protein
VADELEIDEISVTCIVVRRVRAAEKGEFYDEFIADDIIHGNSCP